MISNWPATFQVIRTRHVEGTAVFLARRTCDPFFSTQPSTHVLQRHQRSSDTDQSSSRLCAHTHVETHPRTQQLTSQSLRSPNRWNGNTRAVRSFIPLTGDSQHVSPLTKHFRYTSRPLPLNLHRHRGSPRRALVQCLPGEARTCGRTPWSASLSSCRHLPRYMPRHWVSPGGPWCAGSRMKCIKKIKHSYPIVHADKTSEARYSPEASAQSTATSRRNPPTRPDRRTGGKRR